MKRFLITLMMLLSVSACVSTPSQYTFQSLHSDKIDIRALSARENDGGLQIHGLLFQPGIHRNYQHVSVVINAYHPDGKLIATTMGRYRAPINPKREWRLTGVSFYGSFEKVPPHGSLIKVSFQ